MMKKITWILQSFWKALMNRLKFDYEQIFKLANCLQHKAIDNLLTTFFRVGLVPYLRIAIAGIKKNTIFEHKESMVTCEEIMANVEEYQKLLKPPKKLEKTLDNIRIEKMYNFCHKLGHIIECYHWNLENPNKKLKDKKEVLVNEVSPQARRGTNGNHEKQGNQNQGSSLIYHCFICNYWNIRSMIVHINQRHMRCFEIKFPM